ncbi:MAG: SDR family NAD(P)-dependent oxidoreductase, partial [Prevotellaceae bacterium]|nr:SDR family NAD(P)-dependent oxidoreductase [Prevotellaceae bacterium]
EIELRTVETNAAGFTRMIDTVFHYFERHQERKGQIACVSSIAGTKGLGAAPSYSATKAYCNTYMEALELLATMKHLHFTFTDIRPGFVNTDLLKGDYKYPMMMLPQYVAKALVHGIEKEKRVVTIDWRYRIMVFFWRLIPKCIWVKMKVQ